MKIENDFFPWSLKIIFKNLCIILIGLYFKNIKYLYYSAVLNVRIHNTTRSWFRPGANVINFKRLTFATSSFVYLFIYFFDKEQNCLENGAREQTWEMPFCNFDAASNASSSFKTPKEREKQNTIRWHSGKFDILDVSITSIYFHSHY